MTSGGAKPPWVQPDAHQVDRRPQQVGRGAREERAGGAVGQHDVPPSVENDRGIRLVGMQHPGVRFLGSRQRGTVERQLGIPWREPGGEQGLVAVT
ncbi:hypothetical protein GCM10027569_16950 [Flindersiella endophytica]